MKCEQSCKLAQKAHALSLRASPRQFALLLKPIRFQVYFQRVLSSKTSYGAQMLSYVAGFGCILMAIPPALIGAIARNTGSFSLFIDLLRLDLDGLRALEQRDEGAICAGGQDKHGGAPRVPVPHSEMGLLHR